MSFVSSNEIMKSKRNRLKIYTSTLLIYLNSNR